MTGSAEVDAGQRAVNLRVALQRGVGGPLLEIGSAVSLARARIAGRQVAERQFLIFGRGRSGSTLFVDLLASHPEVFCAGEVLRYRTFAPAAHLKRVIAAGGGHAGGAKLLSYQMRSIHGIPASSDFLRRLTDEGIDIFYLTRRNEFRHTMSNILARKSRLYHSHSDTTGARARIAVSAEEVLAWSRGSRALGEYEEQVLKGVPHRRLIYETDLATDASRQATASWVFPFLGVVPPAVSSSQLKRVTPDNLADVVIDFDRLIDALKGTELARFLPGSDTTTQD